MENMVLTENALEETWPEVGLTLHKVITVRRINDYFHVFNFFKLKFLFKNYVKVILIKITY